MAWNDHCTLSIHLSPKKVHAASVVLLLLQQVLHSAELAATRHGVRMGHDNIFNKHAIYRKVPRVQSTENPNLFHHANNILIS